MSRTRCQGWGICLWLAGCFESSVEDRSAKAIMLFVGVRLVDPAGVPINQDLSKLGQE